MKIERVLAATDFSATAEKALDHAAEYAKHFDAEMTIVHAYQVDIPMASPLVGGPTMLPEGFFEKLGADVRSHVDKIAKKYADQGVRTRGVAVDQAAASAIVHEAETQNADLIVMGTRGLTGLKHVALGSVADRVVRTASCPVLTVGDRSED
ncbi:MAG: universal stress protein [Myxococcota bacterium]